MKFLCFAIKPFKIVLVSALVLLLVLCVVMISETQSVFFGYAARKLPVYSVERTDKKIAITFDAAWGADKTQNIIDILLQKKIKATFFLVGFWVEKYPEMVKKIQNEGMEIGTHSNTHPNMSKLSSAQVRNELETSIKLITDITQKPVSLFRPPFGDYDDKLITVCEEMKVKAIQWDVDSLDWKGISASEIISRVSGGVKGGSIILCHNNSDHIVDALPSLIDILIGRGFEFVTVGELVYKSDFKIDNNGTQIKL